MKRMANLLTGLSIAVLFFATSARAENDGTKMIADIPFEFTVAGNSLPAGQYEFIRTDGNIYVVRDTAGRSLFSVASAAIQPNGRPESSMLKFATVDGHHVLYQIWNERTAIGNEFAYEPSSVEWGKQPATHEIAAGRR
jgi:hypothetical protein